MKFGHECLRYGGGGSSFYALNNNYQRFNAFISLIHAPYNSQARLR